MKVTVVPAQVTTVEDRIIGNLGFSQVLLLIVPIFVGAGLFALLPPMMGGAPYKYVALIVLITICVLLSIRIKGRIVAAWLVTIVRYNVRPKYYLFNKNTPTLREDYPGITVNENHAQPQQSEERRHSMPRLGSVEMVKVLAAIDNPAANFRIETTKKGGLSVHLKEIED
jgi:hypothetical protein